MEGSVWKGDVIISHGRAPCYTLARLEGMQHMRVLVTGGGGYLGSWVTALLLERGHQVRVFDRFCFGREAVSEFVSHENCEIVEGDVRRLQDAAGLFRGVDAVVHLASLSNDPSCNLDADMAQDVNVESTREVARHAAEHGVGRFVLGSSCAVYGRGVFELLDEASPANPVSVFGRTKIAAEQAVLALRSERFAPVVFRTATMYGWSRRMRFDLAVNQMVATGLRQGRIVVRGGGAQWRPFVHVRDAARAMVMGVESAADAVSGEVFNLGSDAQNFRIGELAELVAARLGNIQVELARDDDDQRNFRVRFGKIAVHLGFATAYGVEDGIDEVRTRLADATLDPMAEPFFNVARMKRLRETPVEEGGEPIAARFIPLSKPSLGVEEEQAVIEALRSGWLTSGPNITAFEQSFAEMLEARHAVAVNSCTAALHLCLVDLGVGPGDEVITSPITWSSTGNTILNMGARPVFVDVDPATLNMNPTLLEAAIGPRTKAIMPVHIAGHPCDLEAVSAIAAKHGVPVVEDAAHALGATWRGDAIGTISPYTCFSFYAVKNITTMEGGMISLADADRAAHLRFLATNGMSATAWDRYGRSAVAAPQEVVEPGYKYHMGNVSAAMGLQQLKKLPRFLSARRRLAAMYSEVLREVDEIELPPAYAEGAHAWHLYIIRFRLEKLAKSRDELAHALRRENIGTGVHFHGLHLHKYYRERLGMKPEDFPQATEASRRILSLPLHPEMSDKNVHEVVSALKKVLAHARK